MVHRGARELHQFVPTIWAQHTATSIAFAYVPQADREMQHQLFNASAREENCTGLSRVSPISGRPMRTLSAKLIN